jgi:hypothetical protein
VRTKIKTTPSIKSDDVLESYFDPQTAIFLRAIVFELIRPTKNHTARIYGLIFATGLDKANWYGSQADIARKTGCTRSLISHYKKQWERLIRLGVFNFHEVASTRAAFFQTPKKSGAIKRKK